MLTATPAGRRGADAVVRRPRCLDRDADIGELGKRDLVFLVFFFNDTATTEIYTLSLHDALPISRARRQVSRQTESLICVPGVVAGPSACICEMDAQVHWVGTRSQPGLAHS